ncbi:hypothetical protein B0H19DRAFT_1208166 [Mycena capillaripes]|nr:hypothetical protein B0H19DRAFT_1208166 [Mycena capillaripes]
MSMGFARREEDFSADLQTYLMEVAAGGYVSAQHIMNFVKTDERWLKKLDWRYGKKKKGMYIDRHEREDVVAYRKAFCLRWKEYEKRMVLYDNDGNVMSQPSGFIVPQGPRFRLVAITHDESTFFARDRRKEESLMISDFLTVKWGRLTHEDDEARWLFEAGKNRDGYFANQHLLQQTDKAIDIFEAKTNRTMTGLLLYDKAPTYLKRADDALTARKMVKNPHPMWTARPNVSDGWEQVFYFPADHTTMPG